MRILPYRKCQERRGLDAVLPCLGRGPSSSGKQRWMTSIVLNLDAMRKSLTVYSPATHRLRGDGKMCGSDPVLLGPQLISGPRSSNSQFWRSEINHENYQRRRGRVLSL